jgi:hypothetical protein
MDMDEPVNVNMEPEDALRLLLGEERREPSDDPPELVGGEDGDD